MDAQSALGPSFFLSYAREDEDDSGTIGRLYRDLGSEVARRLGPTYGPAFMDTTGIEPGGEWSDELQHALMTAHAFVAVLSPTYFSRPYCGKEWAAFASRLAGVVNADDAAPRLMQPVLLVPPSDLRPIPEVVASKQFTFDAYPEEYSQRGLRYIHTLPSQVDSYQRFVFELAGVLVTAIRSSRVPRTPLPPLSDIQSAFHNEQANTQRVAMSSAPGSHLFAQFVYVAAKPSELEDIREQRAPYGQNGGLEWQPFLPPVETEIGMIAAEVASRERFRYEQVGADLSLVEQLSRADRANKVIVVVVDPWTVRLDAYRQLMREIDDRNFSGCVIIIPLNTSDTESADQRLLLRQAIEATFVNRTFAPDPEVFLPWISSAEELERQLATALQRAKLRVLSRQERFRAFEEGAFRTPPIVNAVVP